MIDCYGNQNDINKEDQEISYMTSSSIYYFFFVVIPRALQTPSIQIKRNSYNFLVNIWGDDYTPLLHVLEVVETLFILLHFEVVFYNDSKNISPSDSLLYIRLSYNIENTSSKSFKYCWIIYVGLLSAMSRRPTNFSISSRLQFRFDIFAYLSGDVDLDMCFIAYFTAAKALSQSLYSSIQTLEHASKKLDKLS